MEIFKYQQGVLEQLASNKPIQFTLRRGQLRHSAYYWWWLKTQMDRYLTDYLTSRLTPVTEEECDVPVIATRSLDEDH